MLYTILIHFKSLLLLQNRVSDWLHRLKLKQFFIKRFWPCACPFDCKHGSQLQQKLQLFDDIQFGSKKSVYILRANKRSKVADLFLYFRSASYASNGLRQVWLYINFNLFNYLLRFTFQSKKMIFECIV